MKNKICGVGLDCSTLSYRPDPQYLPDYLLISASSNNSFWLEGLTEGKKLIIEVGTSKEGMLEILDGLGFQGIDVLMLPAEEEPNEEILREGIDKFGIRAVGISRPRSLGELKKAAESIKRVILPSYVSLPLCPIYFQKSIIDWSEENGIEIFGLNPFGGSLSAPSVIRSFSIPFLLSFSAAYSIIPFLSGRDLVSASYNSEFLEGLIGKERLKEVEMKSEVIHSVVNPLPVIVKTGLKIGEGVIPYTNPEYLASPDELVLRMNEIEDTYRGSSDGKEVEKVLKGIAEFDLMSLPSHQDPQVRLSIIRPALLKELRRVLGKDYKIDQAKLGDTLFLIRVTKTIREKRYIGRDKKILQNYYYLLDGSGTLRKLSSEDLNPLKME